MSKVKTGEIEMVEIDRVIPWERNRNKHSKEQIERLAKIIEYQGWRHPIVVSRLNGKVAAGHGRLDAAKHLGLDKVPVMYQDFDSEEQQYAFMVSDNAIASWAELDLSGINMDIGDLGPDFDIELLGIKDFSLEPAEKIGLVDEDAVPENVETRVKPGDIWKLGEHRLMCGDSTNIQHVEALMDGEKADMVFTDLPYGVSYEKKTQEIFGQTDRIRKITNDDLSVNELKEVIQAAFHNINAILAEKSCYYIASPQGGELGLMMMMMMQEANIPCRHMIIWVKNAPVFSMGRLDYDYQHEPILYGWSPNRTHYKSSQSGEWKSSVWTLNREPNKLHPTMKPIALMENALKNSTTPGQIVADLFGGSGSTLIAAEKTNRKARLMEIDPHYCSVILKRWEDFTGQQAKRINGDDT